MNPMLKAPGIKRLKLEHDEPPSNFALKINLRHYIEVYANLEPAVGDVDVGERLGVPIPGTSSGQVTDVQVRINTGGDFLTSFQVVLTYNANDFITVGRCRLTLSNPR
jgi:hypothetical protein